MRIPLSLQQKFQKYGFRVDIRSGYSDAVEAVMCADKTAVLCLTDNDVLSLVGNDEQVKQVKMQCLHELGHALGLQGHSASPGDVMFPWTVPSSRDVLSNRDKKTIKRLYGVGKETAC